MTDSLSTLFISHGSPMLALEALPAHHFLKTWGARRRRPRAILVVSAHWETHGGVEISFAPKPATLHDFGGFPQALYDLSYPAPRCPECRGRGPPPVEGGGH